MRVVAALLVTACGRVGFDPTAPAVDGPPIPIGPVAFSNSRPLASLNSDGREFGASLSLDELEIYFSSNRTGRGRVYVATRTAITDDFGVPQIATFNGNETAGEPTLARNGREIYVVNSSNARRATRAADDPASPWNQLMVVTQFSEFLGCDFGAADLRMVMGGDPDDQLYESIRPDVGSEFEAPIKIAELVGYRAVQNYPAMTEDGLEIYFQALDTEAVGGKTILRATRTSLDQPFDPPTVALRDVPAGMSAGDPGISADGKTLYYSLGDSNVGTQQDLWVADRSP